MTYQPHQSEDVTLKAAKGEQVERQLDAVTDALGPVIERDGFGPRTPLRWPGPGPAPKKWTAPDGTVVYRSYEDYVDD